MMNLLTFCHDLEKMSVNGTCHFLAIFFLSEKLPSPSIAFCFFGFKQTSYLVSFTLDSMEAVLNNIVNQKNLTSVLLIMFRPLVNSLLDWEYSEKFQK